MATSSRVIKYAPEDLTISFETLAISLPEIGRSIDCPFYPTDKQLCHLANLSYKTRQEIQENRQDWTLLATGKWDELLGDGFFGAAFWHENDQQLVLSLRGTKDWKAVVADVQGVVGNQYTSQIHSACTFAFLILEKLGNNCKSVSITGHSLGGWLAQVVAFAIEHLKVEGNGLRSFKKEEKKLYHPHTVTFDTPGCYNLLCQLSKDFYHRYETKADDLISVLDITNYFISPNAVNTKNQHVGRLIRFNFEVEEPKRSFILAKFAPHVMKYHPLANFQSVFENFDEVVKYIILDWPIFSIRRSTFDKIIRSDNDEAGKFYQYGENSNNFHPSVAHLNEECIQVHYKTKNYDGKVINISIFNEEEILFLQNWKKLKENKASPSVINEYLERNHLGSFKNFLPDFEIFDDGFECNSRDQLLEAVNLTKRFCAYYSACEVMRKQISVIPTIYEAMYNTAMESYLRTLPSWNISFNDNIGLDHFLESNCPIMLLQTENTKDEAFRLNSILKRIEAYENKYILFHYKDIEYLDKVVDVAEVFGSNATIDSLLIIDLESLESFEFLDKLYEKISSGTRKRIICISQKSTFLSVPVIYKTIKQITLSDLDDNSRKSLLDQKMVSLNGTELALSDFSKKDNFSDLTDALPFDVLKACVLNSKELIKCNFENKHFNQVFLNLTSVKVVRDIKIDIFKHSIERYSLGQSFKNFKFLVTGVTENLVLNELQNKFKDQIILDSSVDQKDCSVKFSELCLGHRKKKIFRFHLKKGQDDDLTLIEFFNPDLYMERNFIAGDSEVKDEDLIKSDQKVILLSNDPGMGKSTSLLNLARNVQNSWVFWVRLMDAHKYLDDSPVDDNSVVDFLLNFTENTCELTKILLKFSLGNVNSVPVFLFFDGFDEIQDASDEKHKSEIQKKVLEIIKYLQNKRTANIFISTRTYDCKRLENELKINAIKLKDVSKEQQVEFYKKFWKPRYCLFHKDSFNRMEVVKRFARDLLKNLNKSITNPLSFLGIPLQLKMISEIFQPGEVKVSSRKFKFTLYELFSEFEKKNYQIYFKEKMCYLPPFVVSRFLKGLKQDHRILGMSHFFPIFHSNISEEGQVNLNRIGFLQEIDGIVVFIHQTFAEYFAAKCFVYWIQNKADKDVKIIVMNKILADPQYSVIRLFINQILEKKNKSNMILPFFSDLWAKLDDCDRKCFIRPSLFCKCKVMYQSISENNSQLIKLLFENQKHLLPKIEYKNIKEESEAILEKFFPYGGGVARPKFLHLAIECVNLETALVLLNYWPDIKIKDYEKSNTCLHLAAKSEALNSLSLELVKKGAEVNILNADKLSPLDLAFNNRNWDLFFRIFNFYEDVENNDSRFLRANWGTTALCAAVENKKFDIAVKLINKGISFDLGSRELLFFRYGLSSLIRMLIDIKKIVEPAANDSILAKEILRTEDTWSLVFQVENIHYRSKENQTFLHLAVAQNQFNIADKLIKKGMDVNVVDANGRTPIYIAAERKNWDFILANFDKIDFKIPGSQTLLHQACQDNNLKILREMANRGRQIFLRKGHKAVGISNPLQACINTKDDDGNTPILIAAARGHYEIVTELIKYNADIKIANRNLETILHFACRDNQVDLVKFLCQSEDIVNAVDKDGNTPLLLAAMNGHWDLISELLNLVSFDVNKPNSMKQTLLHFASGHNKIEIAKKLVENGADVNFQNIDKKTPLSTAAENGHWYLFSELIKSSASLNTSKDFLGTLLLCVSQYRKLDLALYLVKSGADVNASDENRNTPLLLAAENSAWELAAKLIKLNASIDSLNNRRESALFFACRDNKTEIALNLIEKGADMNLCNVNGDTPFLFAIQMGPWALVKQLVKLNSGRNAFLSCKNTLLVNACKFNQLNLAQDLIDEYECNINFTDKDGNTPILIAAREGHWNLVSELKTRNASVDISNRLDQKLLHFICRDNRTLDMDLCKEEDLNLIDKNGDTPVLLAAKEGHWNLFAKLRKFKSVNEAIFGEQKNIYLLLACGGGNTELALDLIQNHNAEVNFTDKVGDTPLLQAARNHHWSLVSYLIDQGAKITTKHVSERTALHFACRDCKMDFVIKFIERGCDVNAVDRYGKRPLDLVPQDKRNILRSKISLIKVK